MFRSVIGSAVVAGALLAQSALACSVTADYVVPSNFELVQIADAIVVATPLGQTGSWDEIAGPSVRFRVQETLKGETPRQLLLPQATLGQVAIGDPNRLIGAHPDAHSGGCIRRTFRRGQPAVLFLARDVEGQWNLLGFPFARVSEDYFGPDALWPRTVRDYLTIQSEYGPMEQLAVLERIVEDELANQQTEEGGERARDILGHLMSRSPWKPTQYLTETYETLERGETPRFAFRSREADQEQSDVRALTALVFGDRAVRTQGASEQMRYVLNALVKGDHPDAAPLFERILTSRPNAWQFGAVVEFLAKHGQYARAYDLVETQAIAMLNAAEDEDALALIRSIQQMQLGDGDWTVRQRWADYPEIATRWPSFAERLWDYQVQRFGDDGAYPFPDVGLY